MKKYLLFLLPVFIISCSQDNPVTVKPDTHGAHDSINFKLKIENVSKSDILKLSNGKSEALNLSKGVWCVYSKTNPLFTNDQKNKLPEMEKLAEDGESFTIDNKLTEGISSTGVFNQITSNSSIEISFSAKSGDKLTFATMFTQSNDLFYSTEGIELFDKDKEPIKGDLTSQISLWDLGTEFNQEPGLGDEQATRQKSSNFGKSESNNTQKIENVKDGFTYPKTTDVLKITLTNDDQH
jgi:hypothetical protein